MANCHLRAITGAYGSIATECEQIRDAIGALQARVHLIDRLTGEPLPDEIILGHVNLLRAWDIFDELHRALQTDTAGPLRKHQGSP